MNEKVKQPIKVALDKDRVYFWCTWGLAEKQPIGDGSHKSLACGIGSPGVSTDAESTVT